MDHDYVSGSILNFFPGVKESDTGLASPNLWDLPADRQRMGEEHPLQVARCTKIIPMDPVAAERARAGTCAAIHQSSGRSLMDARAPPLSKILRRGGRGGSARVRTEQGKGHAHGRVEGSAAREVVVERVQHAIDLHHGLHLRAPCE